MKNIILFAALSISGAISLAQPIPPATIKDSVIGWMKVYHFKGFTTTKKVDDKLYSAAQLSLCDTFANWIQASYLPKGGLGDVKKSVGEQLGLYNQHIAGQPQSYGAYAKTYTELKYNSSRKLEPYTNSHIWWTVFANLVPGEWAVRNLCTPRQFYFTMPGAATEESDEKIKRQLDISAEPSIKPYISCWVKNLGYGRGKEYVILCKDNRSPFVPLTKGDLLAQWETAIPRFYEAEKAKIYEQNKGNQRSIDYFMKYLDEKNERFVTGLKKHREKYKNRLDETALTSRQPSVYDFEFDKDIFSNNGLTGTEHTTGRVPVYTIDPVMAELCKKDKPQWIVIGWDYYPGDPVEQQQHDAIIHNFNFEYVYNFFFDPVKVKGQPYKPLRNPAGK